MNKGNSRRIIAGRYAYEKPLGRGAGGAVYLAEDILSEQSRMVALKVISAEAAATVQGRMIRREFEILSRVDHKNLVHVYDFGMLPGGGVYLAEEYIDGFSMQDARALVEPDQLIDVIIQLLDGLAYLHAMGMIHRDIKPANVMILWHDDPYSKPTTKLVDFGLSSRNPLGDTLRGGTRSYMAPEIVRGESAEFRSDLFSLGVTLYYATCGVIPFGPRSKDDPPITDETFRPPEPHRINPTVPLSLSRFTMVLLRQVPNVDYFDAGQALRALIEDVDERTHSLLKQYNVDLASSSVLRGAFETGLLSYRDQRRKIEMLQDLSPDQSAGVNLIAGPPGVGKSRLLHSISSDYKLAGATVIEIQRHFLLRPFGFVVDVLNQMISLIRSSNIRGSNNISFTLDILSTLTYRRYSEVDHYPEMKEYSTRYRDWLFDAFLYLKSLLKPEHLVIIIDDVDLIDSDSLLITLRLLGENQNLAGTSIYLAGKNGKHVDLLSNHPNLRVFHIDGFKREDLQHFLREYLAIGTIPEPYIDVVMGSSNNYPPFVFEYCNLLIEEGILRQQAVNSWIFDEQVKPEYVFPRTITEIVLQRLDKLNDDARFAINILSLMEEPIEWSLLRTILSDPLSENEVEEIIYLLQYRNYVQVTVNHLGRFVEVTSARLVEIVRESLSQSEFEQLNARIAIAHAAAWGSGKMKPLSVAKHFEAAGPDFSRNAAVFYDETANTILRQIGTNDSIFASDAASFLQRSIDLTQNTDVDPKTIVLRMLKMVSIHIRCIHIDQTRSAMDAVWEKLQEIDGPASWLTHSVICTGMLLEVIAGNPLGMRVWEDRLIQRLPLLMHEPEVALLRSWAYRVQGDFGTAFDLVRRARLRSEMFHTSATLVESDAVMGNLFEEVNDKARAIKYYERAIHRASELHLKEEHCLATIGLGRILQQNNQLNDSSKWLFEGFQIAVIAARPDLVTHALVELGTVLHKNGNHVDALRRSDDALRIAKSLKNQELIQLSYGLQAVVYCATQRQEEGISILRTLLKNTQTIPYLSVAYRLRLVRAAGAIFVENGLETEGISLLEQATALEEAIQKRHDHSL